MKRAKLTISLPRVRVLYLCWCIVALLLAGFLTVSVLIDFHAADGLFAYGSALGRIAEIALTICAFSACFWLFVSTETQENGMRDHASVRVVAGVTSASMLAFVVHALVYVMGGGMLERLSILFAALVCVYFLLIATRSFSRFLPLFAFAPIGFASVYLLIIYFDMMQPLGGEMRILEQMALLSVLLFMLCDVRLYLERCSMRACFFFGVLCLMLAIPYGVSTIAMGLSPAHGVTRARLIVACFVLAYAIYAGVTTWCRFLCGQKVEEDTNA